MMIVFFAPSSFKHSSEKCASDRVVIKKSYKFIDNTNKCDLLIDKADLSDYKTSDIIVVQSKKKHEMICILKYKSYKPIKKMGYRKYQYIRGFYE